ncbi:hypothetical protein M768_00745 [Cellulosimicrobium cellulans F16]|uniref:SHOCT domain-containing protein n=1 Tax=Cellulosimicrobium cellulans F16 TaxID=1350482 RepID=A0A0M0FA75_CELCE|nr:SHOCT domain-containing protein [Cellulosimicrobium cellulans]KON74485.1 hypothetical protein M768_00745 [Cellulosimicrobium cellulans F16]
MATSTFGPVEIVAVAFPTDRIPAGVQASVLEVLAEGTVTLLDLAVVRRSDAGDVEVIEVTDLGDELEITDVELTGAGLAGEEDLDAVAAGLAPGTSALVLVLEHTWARGVIAATSAADGVVLLSERIPAEVVNEVADLALVEDRAARPSRRPPPHPTPPPNEENQMPIRRFGRPGLIGTAARTAVIAGTASATAGAVQRRQASRAQQSWEAQQAEAAQEQARIEAAAQQAAAQYAQPAPAAPAAAPQDDLLGQLERLGQLHASGVLSDAEFAAAKAKLLG